MAVMAALLWIAASERVMAQGAPRNITATPGDGYILLTWDSPGSNFVDLYIYEVSINNGATWTEVPLCGCSCNGYTITGLTNGTTYNQIRVRAVSRNPTTGVETNGTSSGAITSTPQATPTAPQNFIAFPGDRAVYLSWGPPPTNANNIIRYEVRMGADVWITLPANAVNYTFTNGVNGVTLNNGTNYTFNVRAVNAAGDGSIANVTRSPQIAPGAPQNFTAIKTGDGAQVRLTWEPVPISTITGYQVRLNNGVWGPWITLPANTTEYIMTGLRNNDRNQVEIRAINGAINGAAVIEDAKFPPTNEAGQWSKCFVTYSSHTFGPNYPATACGQYTVSGSFTFTRTLDYASYCDDKSSLNSGVYNPCHADYLGYEALIDWGDGTTSTVPLTMTGGNYAAHNIVLTANHPATSNYANVNESHTITVTLLRHGTPLPGRGFPQPMILATTDPVRVANGVSIPGTADYVVQVCRGAAQDVTLNMEVDYRTTENTGNNIKSIRFVYGTAGSNITGGVGLSGINTPLYNGYPSHITNAPNITQTQINSTANGGVGQYTWKQDSRVITIPASAQVGEKYIVTIIVQDGIYCPDVKRYAEIQVIDALNKADDIIVDYCSRTSADMYLTNAYRVPITVGNNSPPPNATYYFHTTEVSNPGSNTNRVGTDPATWTASAINPVSTTAPRFTNNNIINSELNSINGLKRDYYVYYSIPNCAVSPPGKIEYKIRENLAFSGHVISGERTVCDGAELEYEITGNPFSDRPIGGDVAYIWKHGSGITNIEPVVAGDYRKVKVTFANSGGGDIATQLQVYRKWADKPSKMPETCTTDECEYCPSELLTLNVIVRPKPNATLAVSGDVFCLGDASATLTVSGLTNGNTFNIGWLNTTNGATGNLSASPITFTGPTMTLTAVSTPVAIPAEARADGVTEYWISYLNNDACNSSFSKANVKTIERLPVLQLTGAISPDGGVCIETGDVTFSAPSVTDTNVEYVWTFRGAAQTGNDSSIDINMTGVPIGQHSLSVALRYKAPLPDCLSEPLSKTIQISNRPTATASASTPLIRCEGEGIGITGVVGGTTGVVWTVRWELRHEGVKKDEGDLPVPVGTPDNGSSGYTLDFAGAEINAPGIWSIQLMSVLQGGSCVNDFSGAGPTINFTVRERPKAEILTPQPYPSFCPTSDTDWTIRLRLTGNDNLGNITLSYTSSSYPYPIPSLPSRPVVAGGDIFDFVIPVEYITPTLPATSTTITVSLQQQNGCASADPHLSFVIPTEIIPLADAKVGSPLKAYSECTIKTIGGVDIYVVELKGNQPGTTNGILDVGVWDVIDGPNGWSFSDDNDPEAVFYAIETGFYTLEWQVYPGGNISSHCIGKSRASVIIGEAPSEANIIPIIDYHCYDLNNRTPLMLVASRPQRGETGVWSLKTNAYPDDPDYANFVPRQLTDVDFGGTENNNIAYVTVEHYGTYWFYWEIDNGCALSLDSIKIEFRRLELGYEFAPDDIRPIPTPQEWCAGENRMPQFVSNGGISWHFIGNPIPCFASGGNGQFPTQATPANSTVRERYTVEVKATLGACELTQNVQIDIKPKPSPVVVMSDNTIAVGDTRTVNVCHNSWVTFELDPNLWQQTTYSWDGDGSPVNLNINYITVQGTPPPPFVHRFQVRNEGVVPVAVTISNLKAEAGGCTSDPITLYLTVNPKPELTLPTELEFCPGQENISISVNSSAGNANTFFAWSSNRNPGEIGYTLPKSAVVGGNTLGPFTTNDNANGRKITHSLTVVATTINGCETTKKFDIALKPRPQINHINSLFVCPDPDGVTGGTFPANLLFTSNLAAGTVDFTWTLTPPDGIAIPGALTGTSSNPKSENPDIFNYVNNTSRGNHEYQWVVTGTGNGLGDAAGCASKPIEFSMNVYPLPHIEYTGISLGLNTLAEMEVCSNSAFSDIYFRSTVDESAYLWMIDAPTGGRVGAASSIGYSNDPVVFSGNSYNIEHTPYYEATLKITAISPMPARCLGLTKEVSLRVKPSPVMQRPDNVEVCSLTENNTIPAFSITNTSVVVAANVVYDWRINEDFIWEPPTPMYEDGVLQMPPFNATEYKDLDDTGDPLPAFFNREAIVTVTPRINEEGGCIGEPVVFRILQRPVPHIISDLSEQIVCPGDEVSMQFITNISGAQPDGGREVSWRLDEPNISLDPAHPGNAGSGNIAPFEAANLTGANPLTGTFKFTITREYAPGDVCKSPDGYQELVINVKPRPEKPTIFGNPETEYCHSDVEEQLIFVSTPGATFSWTSDNHGFIDSMFDETDDPLLVFTPFNHTPSQFSVRAANIKVWAYSGENNKGERCASLPLEFPIVVKPTPQLAAYAQNHAVCSGELFNIQDFSINQYFNLYPNEITPRETKFEWKIEPVITDTETEWYAAITNLVDFPNGGNWTNSIVVDHSSDPKSPITLISPFTPFITGSYARSMTLTVTPYHAGCEGISTPVTLTVRPKPMISGIEDPLLVCSGSRFENIDLTTKVNVANATFVWNIIPPMTTQDNINSRIGALYTSNASAGAKNNFIEFSDNPLLFALNETETEYVSKLQVTATAPQNQGGCSSEMSETEIIVLQTPVMKPLSGFEACSGETFSSELSIIHHVSTLDSFDWSIVNNTPPNVPASVWITPYSNNIATNASPTNMPPFTTTLNESGIDKTATVSVTATAAHTARNNKTCVSEPKSFTITLKPQPEITSIYHNLSVCPENTVTTADIPNFTFNPTDAAVTPYWTLTQSPAGYSISPQFNPAGDSGTNNIGAFMAGENRIGKNIEGTFSIYARIPRSLTNLNPVDYPAFCESSAKTFTVTVKPTPNTPEFLAYDEVTNPAPFKADYCPEERVPVHLFKTTLPNDPVNVYHTANSLTTFRWEIIDDYPTSGAVSDNIGLSVPATPTSNIPWFTAKNNTLSTATTYIKVTATLNGCSSDLYNAPLIFPIKVKPTPKLADDYSIDAVCSGSSVLVPPFTLHNDLQSDYPENNTNTIYNWYLTAGSWTANATGLPADFYSSVSPSPDNEPVPSFAPNINVNTTSNDPRSMSLWVVPTHAGCKGEAEEVVININPNPRITGVADALTICSWDSFGNIEFDSDVAGSSFKWIIENLIGDGYIGTDDTEIVMTTSSPISFDEAKNIAQETYTATLNITATSGSCEGPTRPVTLTVLQVPVMNNLEDIEACSDELFTNYIPLSITTTGSTDAPPLNSFSWELVHPTPNVWTMASPYSVGYHPAGTTWMKDFTAVVNRGSEIWNDVSVWATARHSATFNNKECHSKPESFRLTVKPRLQINQTPTEPQSVCPDASVTLTPDFAANVGTIYWTLDNTTIASPALPSSGTGGNIPSFTAANVGSSPNIGTFSATVRVDRILPYGYPTGKYNYCESAPETFTVKVTSKPTIVMPPNEVVCNNTVVGPFGFGSSNPSAIFFWESEGHDQVGWSTSGSNTTTDTIPRFTAINSMPNQLTAGVATVKATAWVEGCSSAEDRFTITVKPVPQMLPYHKPNGINVCAGTEFIPDHFVLNQMNKTYFSNDSVFYWTITDWIPESGIPNGDWLNTGYLLPFTPDTTQASYIPPARNPLLGSTPILMTLTVTPWYANCEGIAEYIPITIHPLPVVNNIADAHQIVCSGESFTNIRWMSNVNNPEFWWEIIDNPDNPPLSADIATGASFLSSITSTDGNRINFTNPTKNTVQPFYEAFVRVVASSQAGCVGPIFEDTLKIFQTPVMIPPDNIDACSGVTMTLAEFETSNVAQVDIKRYNWRIEDRSVWNLGKNGTITVPPFTLPEFVSNNESLADKVTTVWVSATHTNDLACTSTEKSFTITVRRAPLVMPVASQTVCPGTKVTIPMFAFDMAGSEVHWKTTDGFQISSDFSSPADSGTIYIPTFTTLPNTHRSAIQGNFTLFARRIYDTTTGAYCDGPKTTFAIQLNPTPDMPTLDPNIGNLDFCHGNPVPDIAFYPNDQSVTFSWKSKGNIGQPTSSGNDNYLPGFTANNNTPDKLGVGVDTIKALAWAAGCPSDTMRFSVRVKPVPQMIPYDDIRVCGGETHLTQPFALNPAIESNYPGNGTPPDFLWNISGWIPESGIPSNNGNGSIGAFTPDTTRAGYVPPNRNPFWGGSATNMRLTVIPIYAGCDGTPVNVSIELRPLPITTVNRYDRDNCLPNNKLKLYLANDGLGLPGSKFIWDVSPLNPTDPIPGMEGPDSAFYVMLRFPANVEWEGTLSLIEKNIYQCKSPELTMPVRVVPKPEVFAGRDREVCFGDTVILNARLITGNQADMMYEWSPPQYFSTTAPTGHEFTLNPHLDPKGNVTMRLEANDIVNGCRSDVSTIDILVRSAPPAPMVPNMVYCESDPLMKLTAEPSSVSGPLFWARLEQGISMPIENLLQTSPGVYAPVPLTDSISLSMNLKDEHPNALPNPLQWSPENSTTILYQVYQTGISGSLNCKSSASIAELKINRSPAPPVSNPFAYCENPGNPLYELSATSTGTTTVAINWYDPSDVDPSGKPKHLGSGQRITVGRVGHSPKAPGHMPFIYHARTTSLSNCHSEPAEIPLTIYPNPALDFILSDKDDQPITTGGCAPFRVFAENTSAENDVDYQWIWTPVDTDDAPVGYANRKWYDYHASGAIANAVRVQLTGVSTTNRETTSGKYCRSDSVRTLYISAGVNANFLATDTVGCDGISVIFTNISSPNAYNFRWYWNTPEPPAFTSGNPEIPGKNESDQFYGTIGSNVIHTFENKNATEPKRYHVWLQVDNGGCHDNKDTIISVYPTPNASFVHNLDYGSVCPPTPVLFTNSSTGIANNLSTRYIWDYNDGYRDTTTIAQPTIHHIFENRVSSTPESHLVRMIAFNKYAIPGRDSLTCSSLPANWQIIVNPQVEARIAGPDEGCSPIEAWFRSQSLGQPTSYSWDFGDGSQSDTGSNPTHWYVNNDNQGGPQDLAVTLIARNTWCSDTVKRPFRLYPQPDANFTVDNLQGCQPFKVTFTNTSNNPDDGTIYLYDFRDGTAESHPDAREVTHVFNNVGGVDLSMTPVMTATKNWNGLKCTSEPFSQVITIYPYLKAKFEMEDSIGCSPLAVRFRNGSLGYDSYEYIFGDGATYTGHANTGILYTHIYQTDNMYQNKEFEVTLTAKFGQCEETQTKKIFVYSTPSADFRPGSPYPADFPFPTPPIDIVNLIPQPDRDSLTYRWNVKEQMLNYDRIFSTDESPTPLEFDDWGYYDITQHVTSPNSVCSDSKTITIHLVPPPPVARFEDVTPICTPDTIEFVNNSLYGRYYKWEFGDGSYSNEKNPKHVFLEGGDYDVILTVIGDEIKESTITKTVKVHPLPQAGFDIQPNFLWVGQPLHTFNYTNNSTSYGQPYDIWYRWNWGDGSPEDTDEKPTHMYRKAGVYDITLTVGTYTNPECSTSKTKYSAVTLENSGDIILPNIFKPNPSGEPSDVIPTGGYRNFLFYPPVLSPTKKYSMMIFTHWGQLIYHTTDPNKGWNGYFNGRLCSEDVYFYRLEGVFETGQSFLKIGDVILFR